MEENNEEGDEDGPVVQPSVSGISLQEQNKH